MPERGHPAWAVHEGGLPGRVADNVKVGPGKSDGDKEHPAPLRVDLLLPPLVYLDVALAVAHRRCTTALSGGAAGRRADDC